MRAKDTNTWGNTSVRVEQICRLSREKELTGGQPLASEIREPQRRKALLTSLTVESPFEALIDLP